MQDNHIKSEELCKKIKTRLMAELRKECDNSAFKEVVEFKKREDFCRKHLQEEGRGPAASQALDEFSEECSQLRRTLYNQLKLQEIQIQAAESERKQKEQELKIEQLQKEAAAKEKQYASQAEALKQQNDLLAKKLEEDIKKMNEEQEQLKKKFDEEIAQAKKMGNFKLMELFTQQREKCTRSPARKKRTGGKPGGIYVHGYTKSNGTKVKGYWR
jgi:DNA anti-recombination protein RmuC